VLTEVTDFGAVTQATNEATTNRAEIVLEFDTCGFPPGLLGRLAQRPAQSLARCTPVECSRELDQAGDSREPSCISLWPNDTSAEGLHPVRQITNA